MGLINSKIAPVPKKDVLERGEKERERVTFMIAADSPQPESPHSTRYKKVFHSKKEDLIWFFMIYAVSSTTWMA